MIDKIQVPQKVRAGACPRCGGRLHLNAQTGELWCSACGFKEAVPVV